MCIWAYGSMGIKEHLYWETQAVGVWPHWHKELWLYGPCPNTLGLYAHVPICLLLRFLHSVSLFRPTICKDHQGIVIQRTHIPTCSCAEMLVWPYAHMPIYPQGHMPMCPYGHHWDSYIQDSQLGVMHKGISIGALT